MELSVYHNIIIIGCGCSELYLMDYEYCKLLGKIELEKGSDPTAVMFVNGYSLLIIGTTNNKIFIIKFI